MKLFRLTMFLCLVTILIGISTPTKAATQEKMDDRVQLAAKAVVQGVFSNCSADMPHNNSDAVYRICRPPRWWIRNGDLMIWAHGYVDPTQPIEIPEDQLCIPDSLCIPDVANFLGYDFATTSYSKNGLAVLPGIADIVELVDLYSAQYGTPNHVYLVGASEGGLITTLTMEQYPQIFDGGLATCGPIGDFVGQTDYFGDFRAAFDYFFPGLVPGDPTYVPQDLIDNWDDYYKTVVVPVLTDPANRDLITQLVNVTHVPYDPNDLQKTVSTSITDVLWYAVMATNDANEVLGGQPFDNMDRVYSGSNDDAALNAGIQRVAADQSALNEMNAHYQTSGVLRSPVVTLHTTLDQQVPYWHEDLYQRKTILHGSWPLFHINYPPTNGYGHCMFDIDDVFGAYGLMLTMAAVDPINQAYVDALLAELGPDTTIQLHHIPTSNQ